jgi:hypothetical protein
VIEAVDLHRRQAVSPLSLLCFIMIFFVG